MDISSIRNNDYYKYGLELPLLVSAFSNAALPDPVSCIPAVLVAGIGAYGTQKKLGNELSRLFNFAAATACGIGISLGLDSALLSDSFVVDTLTDTVGAFSTYAGLRIVGSTQKPQVP